MASTQLRTGWGALVQALVDSEGQGVRARILLECIAREPWVEACGLWRRQGNPLVWTGILRRGSHELLPDQGFVEEVAAGGAAADLLPGRGVLLSGKSEGALALTYAANATAEADLDLIAGLLHVARLVDAAEAEEHTGRLEAFVPALPRGSAELARPGLGQDCQPALLLASLKDSEALRCSQARIAFELELEPGVEACRVRLSPPEFVQAVQNLVSNAREALEHKLGGGRIRVSLRCAQRERLVLAVADTGPGLPQEILEALRDCGPDGLPGPGLGLAVCWGIALSAGGQLRAAESSPDGTRIEIELPSSRLS